MNEESTPVFSKYWSDSSFQDFSAPDIVAWKLARSAIEHENSLVNQRMTWFLTGQAFLMTAFFLIVVADIKGTGVLVKQFASVLLLVIGVYGAYLSLITYEGLNRAFIATSRITEGYNNLRLGNMFDPIVPPLHLWEDPNLMHQQNLPIFSVGLWAALVVIAACSLNPSYGAAISDFFTVERGLWLLAVVVFFAIGYVLRGSRFFRLRE